MSEKKLVQLAIAYKLACEFDYCPDSIEDIGDFMSVDKNVKEAIKKYSGNRPDEIARMLVAEIL